MPERRSSSSRPIALRSLAAQTAVGSWLRPNNFRAASIPACSVKSPSRMSIASASPCFFIARV